MRLVFMGTPQFAAEILAGLAGEHEVECAYTMPDKIRGRGKKATPSPVKEKALSLGISVRTPESLRDPEELSFLESLSPDAICVAAYGRILPQEVLDIPTYGCLNVHASLLPKWRGAAPVERAILEGDEAVGVSIMRMEAGLDTGDYCLQRQIEAKGKSSRRIMEDLGILGTEALLEALSLIGSDDICWVKQDEDKATYAEKISKGELFADPESTSEQNLRRVLASSDAHPCKILLDGGEIILLEATVPTGSDVPDPTGFHPGDAFATRKRLFLMSSDGWIEPLSVKPAGRKAMDIRAYLSGARVSDSASWATAYIPI